MKERGGFVPCRTPVRWIMRSAVVSRKDCGKPFDQSATFDAPNRGTLMIFGEGIH
jgi:hypothetical protein